MWHEIFCSSVVQNGVSYLDLVPLGSSKYEIVRDAGGGEVPGHAHGQRVAAGLRRAAAHQERAHGLRAQHLQGYLKHHVIRRFWMIFGKVCVVTDQEQSVTTPVYRQLRDSTITTLPRRGKFKRNPLASVSSSSKPSRNCRDCWLFKYERYFLSWNCVFVNFITTNL